MEPVDVLSPEREIDTTFKQYFVDTSNSIDAMLDPVTGLPADMLCHNDDGSDTLTTRTSMTNIGLAIPCIVAQWKMGLKPYEIAEHQVENIIRSLSHMKDTGAFQNGLFNNWVNLDGTPYTDYRPHASSVDHAWLITGLEVGQNAFQCLAPDIKKLREEIAFDRFYCAGEHLMYGALSYPDCKPDSWLYRVRTEARQAAYVGGLYGLPPDVLHHMEGNGLSWNGSMFEVCMPIMFDDEPLDQHRPYIQAQIAESDTNHLWGKSPCLGPGGYGEFGVKKLARSPAINGEHVISPYSSFQALPFGDPGSILSNLEMMRKLYPTLYIEGFGFGDSVDTTTGKVVRTQLFVDQAMSLLPIYNYYSNDGLHAMTPEINKQVASMQ